MKTWKEFFDIKEAMGTNPPPRSQRRSATLNLDPAQKAAGVAAQQAAQQAPSYGAPASDEEMGAQYAKSMQVQQAMAAAQRARQARQ